MNTSWRKPDEPRFAMFATCKSSLLKLQNQSEQRVESEWFLIHLSSNFTANALVYSVVNDQQILTRILYAKLTLMSQQLTRLNN